MNNLCLAIRSEHGIIVVDTDKCTGCGACTIACPMDAFTLAPRASLPMSIGDPNRLDRR